MGHQIKVSLTDGTAGAGAAVTALIKITCPDGTPDAKTYSKGPWIEFLTPEKLFGTYDWKVEIMQGGNIKYKSIEYNFLKLKGAKLIEEALEKKKAAMVMGLEIEDPPPPPPPPPGRKLATYKEAGAAVADVPWVAGMESGVTNSLGEVWISYTGPVTLTIVNGQVGSLVDDETVEINITDIYE